MNRTSLFLGAAALLLLLAVAVGLPRLPQPTPAPTGSSVSPTPPPPQPQPQLTPAPGSLSLTGRLSHPYLVPGNSDVYATLEVSAVDVPGAKRAPVNLAVVIDRSGSMAGSKIENARRAASHLVDLLGDDDRLSVVHYGTDVTSLGGLFATQENKAKFKRFIAAIIDEGGTNIGEGLATGQKLLRHAQSDFRVNRLLLMSDGQPTVGLTSPQALAKVVRNIRETGISVTSLGVGADFNEDLMQRLADVGGGSYGFISDATAMASLFEKDLAQAGAMVARTVSLNFELPAGVSFVEVYGRPASQVGGTVSITLPDFSARQTEKLVVHLRAAPSVRTGAMDIAAFQLAYTDMLTERAADARLSLAAMVTEDGALARRNLDKSAVVTASKARAADNYQRAAELIDRGDYGEAQSTLRMNEGIFREAEQVAGPAAMAEEKAINQGIFGLSTSAPHSEPEQRRSAIKAMKSQSLRSSGRGTSVY